MCMHISTFCVALVNLRSFAVQGTQLSIASSLVVTINGQDKNTSVKRQQILSWDFTVFSGQKNQTCILPIIFNYFNISISQVHHCK